MDISVIVLCYNQAASLARALDSVLEQQFDGSMEIVVADDCSTDGTLAVARDYEQRYPEVVRVLDRSHNLGLRANYFDALDQCRGRYIADCAGDDFWVDPLKLQKQFEVMERHPEVTLVHTEWRMSDPDGSHPRPRAAFAAPDNLVEALLRHDRSAMIHLSTALYRKAAFDAVDAVAPHLFRDPRNRCEDLPIVVALAATGKVVWMPEVTLNYCVGHTSVSNPPTPRSILRQYSANLYQTWRLAAYFGVPQRKLLPYYLRTLRYLAATAAHALHFRR